MDRNFSFSVLPEEPEALANVKKLKEYCKSKHISFSSFVLQGIAHVVKELKL